MGKISEERKKEEGLTEAKIRCILLHIYLSTLFITFLFGFDDYLVPIAVIGAYVAMIILSMMGIFNASKAGHVPYEKEFISKFIANIAFWKKSLRVFYFLLIAIFVLFLIPSLLGNEQTALLVSATCGALIVIPVLGFLGLLDVYNTRDE
ncbi:MAG: hypothetical protein U9N35_09045 [Euryarchaeota archaeon]|nr:hypothetical protein [Euryarchaeota archaeon]